MVGAADCVVGGGIDMLSLGSAGAVFVMFANVFAALATDLAALVAEPILDEAGACILAAVSGVIDPGVYVGAVYGAASPPTVVAEDGVEPKTALNVSGSLVRIDEP